MAVRPVAGPSAGVFAYWATELGAGETVAMADLEGSAVLINGWASWCKPCRDEMPFLAALQADNGHRGLRVVGVTADSRRVTESAIVRIASRGVV